MIDYGRAGGLGSRLALFAALAIEESLKESGLTKKQVAQLLQAQANLAYRQKARVTAEMAMATGDR